LLCSNGGACPLLRKGVTMRKAELEHLLEEAVAKALGVKLPVKARRRMVPAKKAAQHPVRHAA
jgi:hypothetical protein